MPRADCIVMVSGNGHRPQSLANHTEAGVKTPALDQSNVRYIDRLFCGQ